MMNQKSREVDKTIYDVVTESLRESQSIRTKTIGEYDFLVAKVCREQIDKTVDAATAIPILHQVRMLVEEDLKARAQRFSRMRWLWYLRRMPLGSIFHGLLKSTLGYDAALLEVLCGYAPKENNRPHVPLRYPINANDIRRCLELCHGIQYLSNIHVFLRYAGKGASIKFGTMGPLKSIVERATEDGIALYDKRVENSGNLLGRFGTVLNSEFNEELTIVPYFRLDSPEFLPPLFSDDFEKVEVLSNCCPQPISLAGFSEFAGHPALAGIEFLSPRASSLLLLLTALPHVLYQLDAAPRTVMKNGYFLLSNDLLRETMNQVFDKAGKTLSEVSRNIPLADSADLALQELAGMAPSLWPIDFPSPLIPVGTDAVCCDVLTASSALLKLCEFPRLGGNAANARSKHFELATQGIINQSAYKPSDAVEQIRGRTLTLQGNNITDIDAIGAKDDTVFLVQCKSLVYRDQYDMGESQEILNAWSTVENGLKQWKQRVKTIEQNPIGDNYDLSAFKTFVPVLCTPQPVYVPVGDCTAEVVPGLRATATPQELNDFFSSDASSA